MDVAIVTGSAGLVGSEMTRRLHREGFEVVGIDNDLRAYFFGPAASTKATQHALRTSLKRYQHREIDIRDQAAVDDVFAQFGRDIRLVVHTAAQPSHDWAARAPLTDFSVNALGTVHLLESTRRHCPEAVFIFTSTNKVYGDQPNALPLEQRDTRWEITASHRYFNGIDESMPIDQSRHSVFGASKVAADVMVQEYGRYFGLRTVCFRCGCLTGPAHAGAELHGFLAFLMKCTVEGVSYRVFGYQGKQVRDNIHSADLVEAFWQFYRSPRCGEVYNIGGGRACNCSMLEAIALCEEIAGKTLRWSYEWKSRVGDHVWWISDLTKFRNHYPKWSCQYDLKSILQDLFEARKHSGSTE